MDKDITKDVIGQSEDALQQKCVFWFNREYPQYRGLLFAVPNGGTRNAREAIKFQRTGLVPGVSDMILLVKSKATLFELKTETGRVSKTQKAWLDKAWVEGFDGHIIRSLSQFKEIVRKTIG